MTSEKEVSVTDRRDRSIALYNLRWALTHLKKTEILESGGRGIWILKDKTQKEINPQKIITESKKLFNEEFQERKEDKIPSKILSIDDIDVDDIEENLEKRLLEKIKKLDGVIFEKLCGELLRKIGFVDVKITPPTKNDGVDGVGILKISDILSYHVAFQCKRYSGVVPKSDITKFRGSMKSGIDRGIMITTGKFSPDAEREAFDLGKVTIVDLIDGELLIKKIKETELGVKVEQVLNIVSIDNKYFDDLK